MAYPLYLNRGDGERVAYSLLHGATPGVVWLGGFRSDMNGTKAQFVAAWAGRVGRSYLRFDYFGHGCSSGRFADGTISRWRDDALAAIDALTDGPQILVGSSMGGWLAMLTALARPERVAGLVLIAPASDFTEELMWNRMPDDVRKQVEDKGAWIYAPEDGGDPYPIACALIKDGRQNLILGSKLSLSCPVRILHGMADGDVPWKHSLRLAEMIEGDVTVTLLRSGDHRLSTPRDLKLLDRTLTELIEDIAR
jgi:pimeloyl-ACP methyl ester carboxylesterase